ncbi:hypothetical protein EmuJ_000937400 [Echinococcus multilocularis]|uniref:Uncharacterized protein n=1 Tax=Echinococcus multilocularis TaxID=6211 RepID=A0A068YEF7_ECHMU|nr:hypothetical protein EmuJ_000937400 [Echinococcus multilocularis]
MPKYLPPRNVQLKQPDNAEHLQLP